MPSHVVCAAASDRDMNAIDTRQLKTYTINILTSVHSIIPIQLLFGKLELDVCSTYEVPLLIPHIPMHGMSFQRCVEPRRYPMSSFTHSWSTKSPCLCQHILHPRHNHISMWRYSIIHNCTPQMSDPSPNLPHLTTSATLWTSTMHLLFSISWNHKRHR